MDIKGLKAATAIEWRPESFCVPVCDSDDASKTKSIDLMKHMSGKAEHDGRKHKVSHFSFCNVFNYHS